MYRTVMQRQAESARNYADPSFVDPSLQTLVSLAATTLGFSMALISILDDTTTYIVARHNLGVVDGILEMPRGSSGCQFIVDSGSILAVADANDPSLTGDEAETAALLRDTGMASYLGVPLYGREGVVTGTLCLLDPTPHPMGSYTRETLTSFASVVEKQLESIRDRVGVAPSASATVVAAAMEAGEIVPYFQPIIDARTGRVFALETLARWEHPTDGLRPPSDFLPAISGSDLLLDLDQSMLVQALESMAVWLVEQPELTLNANLSARHLSRPHGADELYKIVAGAGVPPSSVVFELTEAEAHPVDEASVAFVKQLQDYGFRVILDDIGIGWSSLERLLDLPVDGFKVDSAIAARLGTPRGDAMARALLSLAADTGQYVIVEGIETSEQASIALDLGFRWAQGFLWSPAVPSSDLTRRLTHEQR